MCNVLGCKTLVILMYSYLYLIIKTESEQTMQNTAVHRTYSSQYKATNTHCSNYRA